MLIDDALARSRLSAQWTYEVGRSTTATELVNDGLGVALLPRSAVRSVSGRHLKFQNLSNPVVARPVGLLTRVGVSDNSATGLLKSALRRCSQSLGHD